MYVDKLHHELVVKSGEVFELLAKGDKQRSVGVTNMNDNSSRSHAIATLVRSKSKV